ncbi:flavin reductase family protein [Gordonia rhizosphera]|uniref:Putative oxidoreductase n=1 Tax=Gordonia rhizosphera NBRC 16068 TaxID=1108045 RepID=K6WUD2_9ACTN|nr:flavin reductase family protein [Gordonia rhizosphera]GAB90164.1 putative oxidoreductase [Gordonia rhizosphera NBRC 16068]
MTATLPLASDITTQIDQLHYRTVMGHLPTGVVVLAVMNSDYDHPCGLVVGTFQSLSLDPALVTFSVAHTSTSWPKVRAAGRLSASVLAAGQEPVCGALSRKQTDKFDGVDWALSDNGSPRIAGAHAWIDCEVAHEFDGGDHVIVIARVLSMDVGIDSEPLVFHRGRLGGLRDAVA